MITLLDSFNERFRSDSLTKSEQMVQSLQDEINSDEYEKTRMIKILVNDYPTNEPYIYVCPAEDIKDAYDYDDYRGDHSDYFFETRYSRSMFLCLLDRLVSEGYVKLDEEIEEYGEEAALLKFPSETDTQRKSSEEKFVIKKR